MFTQREQQDLLNWDEGPLADMLRSLQQDAASPPPVYSATLAPAFLACIGFHQVAEETYARQRKISQQGSKRGNETLLEFQHSQLAPVEHGIAPSMESLRPISLREIARKVNYIHTDRVLFATIIHRPYRIIGTSILIEDDFGDCLLASVYNYVNPDEDPDDLLPLGTHIALMAPYMRNSQDDRSKNLMLRCDNPQCVVVFPTFEAWDAAKRGEDAPPEREDPSELRLKGNEAFKDGRIVTAIRFYSRALACLLISQNDLVACLANRAEMYTRRGQWEDAERDCREVLAVEQNHAKASFRLAKSLIHLGNASEASKLLRGISGSDLNRDSPFQNLLIDTDRLCREEKGEYDLNAMRKEAENLKMNFHADYVSESIAIGVEVDRSPIGQYRCCIATKDIEAGELVCASKALAFAPQQSGIDLQFQVNTQAKQLETGSDIALIGTLVNLMWRRPSLGKKLYQLSSGNATGKQIEIGKIDVGRIRGIKTSNAFRASDERSQATQAWKIMRARTDLTKTEKFSPSESGHGSGLWITESMFNHSCTPNCTWFQIGDHIFIRSARKIHVGEEATITYVDYDKSYAERVEIFQNWISSGSGFKCACDWCCVLRSSPLLQSLEQEVHAAYGEASRLVSTQGLPMADAGERVLSQRRRLEIMEALARHPLHIQHCTMQKLHVMQGAFLNARNRPTEALQCFQQASAIGYVVYGETYPYCEDLWRVLGSALRCGLQEDAVRALESVRNTPIFLSLDTLSTSKSLFIDLTYVYSAPWYTDKWCSTAENYLRKLALQIWDRKSVTIAKTQTNKSNVSSKKKKGRK